MRVSHPSGPYQGMPPENVYFVTDDMGLQIGLGYVLPFYQPALFPECPMNIYLQIEGQAACRYMLFGALLARAKQIRATAPALPTRVYTQVDEADTSTADFYVNNGFKLDDAEDMIELQEPQAPARVPMSCAVTPIQLTGPADQTALLSRHNQYRIAPIPMEMLYTLMQTPHFMALGLLRNNQLIGELLASGSGRRADIVSLYIVPDARRMGMGKALLYSGLSSLLQENVTQIQGLVLRRSPAQAAMAQEFQARFVKTTAYYPGLYL